MAIETAPLPSQPEYSHGERKIPRPAMKWFPGWARFIAVVWTICLLLLGLQQLSLSVFLMISGS